MNMKKKSFLVVLASLSLTLAACNNGGGEEPTSSEPTTTVTSPTTTTTTTTSQVSVKQISIKEGTTLKESYNVGEDFSVAGGVLIVKMSDNTRKEVPLALSMIRNVPNMNEEHLNYEVFVDYEGQSTSYFINVIDPNTKTDVTIGISYKYNGSGSIEITNDENVITFTVGKEYKFYYGANPNEAADSIGFKFYTRDEEHTNLGTTYPTDIGEYEYRAYISESDEVYNPVERVIKFDIVAPHVETVLVDATSLTELTDTPSNGEKVISGVTFKYKNAIAAPSEALSLVKQADAAVVAGPDDNYIEVASPIDLRGPLHVNFEGLDNYVRVYGSYDGENFILVDTLTRAKNDTTRAQDYCFIRLVGSPIGHANVDIESISFEHEVDGVVASTAGRAEKGDLIKTASSSENNAYFHYRGDNPQEDFFDVNKSTRSMGIRLHECDVKILFNTVLTKAELPYYKLVFKTKPTADATYQATNSSATVKENAEIWVRPTDAEANRLGKQLKMISLTHETEWQTVECNLMSFFDVAEDGVAGVRLHLNHKCATGAIIFDDIRLVQKDNFPVKCALEYITVENMQTLFERGDDFAFGGAIKAYFSDGSYDVIPEDDPNVEFVVPSLLTSGDKEVVVSYTFDGVKKSVAYDISVHGENPKGEETLPIIDDANDIADEAHRYHASHTYDIGRVTNETTNVYGTSTKSIKVDNFPIDDADYYFTLFLDTAVVANKIHVGFFVKGLGKRNLYVQLYEDDPSLSDESRALRGESETRGEVSTNQTSEFHFIATDAGNGWTYYEYNGFVASHLENGIKVIRISNSEKLTSTSDFYYIDGIDVSSAD